jgi:hypothetical protein
VKLPGANRIRFGWAAKKANLFLLIARVGGKKSKFVLLIAPLRAGENEVIAGGVDSRFVFSVLIA